MNISTQLAKHLRDIHFGGNWTVSNFKDQLKDIDWQEAIAKIPQCNSIAILFFHSTYYVNVLKKVLEEGVLDGKDELSFQLPPINSQNEWEELLNNAWDNAEQVAKLLEDFPENKLSEHFVNPKYGTYYRNIAGVIEHLHYHLGQIAILKKMV